MLYDAYEMQRSLLAGASTLANIGAGWLQQPGQSLRLLRRWGRSSPRRSTSSPMPRRRAASRNSASTHTIVDGKKVAVTEEIVLRKPFGQLKHFVREEACEDGPQAADRRADVGPLCDPAARHGRADAAGPRRLHHRLARREAGAARATARFDLDDYIDYLIEFLEHIGPGRAHARGLPAVGAGLCRRRADERRTSIPAGRRR